MRRCRQPAASAVVAEVETVGEGTDMRVLIGCEKSGIVRDAFAARGHDAWSCDIQPSERPGNHIQDTILSHAIWKRTWDLFIAHPDCTFLTVSGARWMSIPWRQEAQLSALFFVRALWNMPADRICLENPVGKLSSLWTAPTQIVEPYMFGDPFKKATCLWLKNLPTLQATNVVSERKQQCWLEAPSAERKSNRSRTYQGIADAMAEQWG
jgi:hypothetical protein